MPYRMASRLTPKAPVPYGHTSQGRAEPAISDARDYWDARSRYGVPGGGVLCGSGWWCTRRGLGPVRAHDQRRPPNNHPTMAIVLVAAGAFVLANLVAAIPGLQAARTRTALLLQAE